MQTRFQFRFVEIFEELKDVFTSKMPSIISAVVPDRELKESNGDSASLLVDLVSTVEEFIRHPRLREWRAGHPHMARVIDQSALQPDVLAIVDRLVRPNPVSIGTLESHVVLLVGHEPDNALVREFDFDRITLIVFLDFVMPAWKPFFDLALNRLRHRLLVVLRDDTPDVRHRDRVSVS